MNLYQLQTCPKCQADLPTGSSTCPNCKGPICNHTYSGARCALTKLPRRDRCICCPNRRLNTLPTKKTK